MGGRGKENLRGKERMKWKQDGQEKRRGMGGEGRGRGKRSQFGEEARR